MKISERPLDNTEPVVRINNTGKVVFLSTLSVFISMCLVVLYDTEYGFMLFIGVPLSIGFIAGYSMKKSVKSIFTLFNKTLLLFLVITILLIVCRIEGGICIMMIAVPLYVLLLFSYALGNIIKKRFSTTSKPLMFSLFLMNPFFVTLDLYTNNGFTQVVENKITVNTDARSVWALLNRPVVYSTPENILFKYGVNYPKSMQINKLHDSLFLNCNLRNGNANLQISGYFKDSLLRFEPRQAILPIKELTIYKTIHTPHSHDAYFKINYGEFMIKPVNDNKTELYATTELTHHLRPYFYWNMWNKYILHRMHEHVLETIKQDAETR